MDLMAIRCRQTARLLARPRARKHLKARTVGDQVLAEHILLLDVVVPVMSHTPFARQSCKPVQGMQQHQHLAQHHTIGCSVSGTLPNDRQMRDLHSRVVTSIGVGGSTQPGNGAPKNANHKGFGMC